MTWAGGVDPIQDIMKQLIQHEQRTRSNTLELIICAKCHKAWTWDNTRKLLDERGDFVEYRCASCVTEGAIIE